MTMTMTILDTIKEYKLKEIEKDKKLVSVSRIEELAKAAYEQLHQLPYYNSFFQCTHPPAIELSEKLAEISPHLFNHVFFVKGI